MAKETTILGGGCFWCLEAVYQQLEGVTSVVSGYTGGQVDSPTYEQVCAGTTGHAEVVRLEFDTDVVSFREILEVFFTIHDPTTLNRQGNDVGTQYRSGVYFLSEEQRETTRQIIAEMGLVWDAPIVTEVVPAGVFYPAEEYHHNFYQRHPFQGYCAFVIAPKLEKFRAVFGERSKLD